MQNLCIIKLLSAHVPGKIKRIKINVVSQNLERKILAQLKMKIIM